MPSNGIETAVHNEGVSTVRGTAEYMESLIEGSTVEVHYCGECWRV